MTDWNAMTDEEFRLMVRADLEEHFPSELRFASRRLTWDEQEPWLKHLVSRGWVAPSWPVEYGGMGLEPIKHIIWNEEHERLGAQPYREQGVTQVGPMIQRWGNDEQKEKYLPPIVRCEHHWAQGYSEPEAGSDLASLRTKAVRDGDEYVLDGQKIWTTQAQYATHFYILARTDPDAKKQAGISFFVTEIDAPGITVRPIRDIADHVELCEVFMDGLRVPAENMIGEENQGWTLAKSLLGHERITIGSPAGAEYGIEVLGKVARARGLFDDPAFEDQYAKVALDVAHLRDAYQRYRDMVARGEEIGPDVSMLKILATEVFAEVGDLIVETAGEFGAMSGTKVPIEGDELDVIGSIYRARSAMIYGGSNEIQRNIIATAVLGLPRK